MPFFFAGVFVLGDLQIRLFAISLLELVSTYQIPRLTEHQHWLWRPYSDPVGMEVWGLPEMWALHCGAFPDVSVLCSLATKHFPGSEQHHSSRFNPVSEYSLSE